MADDIIELVRGEIAKQRIAEQQTDDVALRKLCNVFRAAASAIEDLMGSPAQNRNDGITSVSFLCPTCGQPMKIVRKPTDGGQRITGTCEQCGGKVSIK